MESTWSTGNFLPHTLLAQSVRRPERPIRLLWGMNPYGQLLITDVYSLTNFERARSTRAAPYFNGDCRPCRIVNPVVSYVDVPVNLLRRIRLIQIPNDHCSSPFVRGWIVSVFMGADFYHKITTNNTKNQQIRRTSMILQERRDPTRGGSWSDGMGCPTERKPLENRSNKVKNGEPIDSVNERDFPAVE